MTVRNHLCAGVAVVAVAMAGPAFAQSASVNWSGPYVGGFGGGGGGQSAQQDSGIPVVTATPVPVPVPVVAAVITPPVVPKPPPVRPPPPPPPPPGDDRADGHYGISGGLGGALIGYNYQFNQVVIGLEGDIGGG